MKRIADREDKEEKDVLKTCHVHDCRLSSYDDDTRACHGTFPVEESSPLQAYHPCMHI